MLIAADNVVNSAILEQHLLVVTPTLIGRPSLDSFCHQDMNAFSLSIIGTQIEQGPVLLQKRNILLLLDVSPMVTPLACRFFVQHWSPLSILWIPNILVRNVGDFFI